MRVPSCCRRPPLLLSVATTIALAAPAAAAEATTAGARALVATFETYLGSTAPGEAPIVTATPAGEAYAVEIDIDRIARPLRGFGLDLRAGHLKMRLEPAGDGTWRQSVSALGPIAVAFQGQTTQIRFDDLAGEGVFDPRIAAFTRHHTTVGGVVSTTARPESDGEPAVDLEKKESGLVVDGTAAASAVAGTDVDLRLTTVQTVQTIHVSGKSGDGLPEMTFSVGFDRTALGANFTGLRTVPMRDLWAHLVAHHTEDDFRTGHAALVARVRDALPIFDRVHYGLDAAALSIETPFGFGGVKTVEIGVDLAGVVRDGRFRCTTHLTGLEAHSMLLPNWIGRLLPAEIALSVAGGGYDLATPAAALLDTADLAAAEPLSDEDGRKIGAMLLPTGRMEIDLSGNRIASPLYEATLDGRLTVAEAGAVGTLTVRAKGLDAVEKLLADPKTGAEGAAAHDGLVAMIALADRGPDGLAWRIDVDGDRVMVNGRPMTPEAPAAPKKQPTP
jgi:hypothetical protein